MSLSWFKKKNLTSSGGSWIFLVGGAKYLWNISNSFKNFAKLSTSAMVHLFEYNIGYGCSSPDENIFLNKTLLKH